jgi:4-hydroxybenzoate polyprenyltransferase
MVVEAKSRISTTLMGLAREVRPRQWYKQSVMLFGIVFSRNLGNIAAWQRLLVGISAFTAVVSAVYIFNDISDLEEDRNHPEKRHRPIASGQVSVPVGAGAGGVLAVVGIAAALWLDPRFLAVLLTYLFQNVLYSLYLKEVALVDVIVVAVGFVLRAIAGVIAIRVFLSPWLIVCTFLLALMLALGKRRHEFETATDTRAVLDEYTAETLNDLLLVVTGTLLMAYSLYTFFRADSMMMLTLPFAFFAAFRYYMLLHISDIGNKPESLLRDGPSVLNAVLWGILAVAVLYDVPSTVYTVVI